MRAVTRLLFVLGILLLVSGCSLASVATATLIAPTATASPAASVTAATVPATATPPVAATVTRAATATATSTVPTPAATITSAPTTAATAEPAGGTPAATSAPVDDAVQALLDYFTAINNQDYSLAYSYWANGGAASGQSYQDFARGFASTVQVTVLVGNTGVATATAEQAIVPVRLLSVVNLSESEQAVQRYQITYDMAPGADHWVIASASVSEESGMATAPDDVADPLALLQSYVRAINFGAYGSAYTYWGSLGQDSKQTFAQFAAGFSDTQSVAIDVGQPQSEGAAGSIYADVPMVLVSTHDDGSTTTFCGTYTTRRTNVPPFEQFGWRIVTASLKQTTNVTPGSAEAQALLTSCQ